MTTTRPTERQRRRTGVRALAGVAALLMLGLPGATASANDGYPLRANVASLGDPSPDIIMRGSGWGHSAGMSQYGAYAMARAGRSRSQIIQQYYPGVEERTYQGSRQITARLLEERDGKRTATVTAERGPLTWRLCTGESCSSVQQPRGETWEMRAVGTASPTRTQVFDEEGRSRGVADRWVEARLTPSPDRFDPQGPADARIQGVARGTGTFAYGWVRFRATSGTLLIDNLLHLEGYLRGIAEVPSSWGSNGGQSALEAQAILARTYALRSGRSLCATPRCQVFAGVGKEREAGGGNWVAAVAETRDRVVHTPGGGSLAETYYSSSHGGRTEASEDSWPYGGAVSYLRSVDDPWSLDAVNPMRSWTSTARNAELRRVTGSSGIVTQVEVRTRTPGGSPSTLRVHSLDGSVRDFGSSTNRTGCNRRHAGNRLRCDLPVTSTRNAAGAAFTGSGVRVPSTQISTFGFGPFTDDVGSLHEYATVWANRAGIAQGTSSTTYHPRRAVTRAQMASFLDRTFELPAASGQPFRDVSSGPHRDAIAAVAAAGVAQGYDDGNYRPDQAVTREQMATFLTRAMGLTPRNPSFSDVSGVHARNVGALAHTGITAGCSGNRFCPQDPVRRDQMATFLYRAARTLR